MLTVVQRGGNERVVCGSIVGTVFVHGVGVLGVLRKRVVIFNGAARGAKTSGSLSRGRYSGCAESGRGGYAKFCEGEEEEQGHAEVLMGEVNVDKGDGDGEEKEWGCDSGAHYHTSSNINPFSFDFESDTKNVSRLPYTKDTQLITW